MGDNRSTCGRLVSVLWGIPSVLWRLFNTVGGQHQYRIPSVHVGVNISIVEDIQYGGYSVQILISACLAIENDEKISIFFCITKQNFHSEKFWQISYHFRAGLVYFKANLVSK